jgi:hypothetical protein
MYHVGGVENEQNIVPCIGGNEGGACTVLYPCLSVVHSTKQTERREMIRRYNVGGICMLKLFESNHQRRIVFSKLKDNNTTKFGQSILITAEAIERPA